MNKLLFCTIFLTQAFAAAAQSDQEIPYLTKPLTNEAVREIEVKTGGGNIAVTGVADGEARIEVYVSTNNREKLSADVLKARMEELYTLEINVNNHKLSAIAKAKRKMQDWKKSLNIGFKIYAPQTVSTNLHTSGGSISLVNLQGEQNFATSGGSLHVKRVGGALNGLTSGGSIHLDEARDKIELQTSGGSIHAKNSSGQIKLATSGGSLELVDLNGTIKATTSGGSIQGKRVQGELVTTTSGGSINLTELSASVETATSGGQISLSFRELGNYVNVHNSAGDVNLVLPKNRGLDLNVSGRVETRQLTNFDGRMGDRQMQGKLNGGGVPVTVKADNGQVRIELQ